MNSNGSGTKARLRHAAAEWLLPPAVKRAIVPGRRTADKRPPTPEEQAILASNARLNGTYAGRRCFVLGNGPSLATAGIERLGGEITIVMNAFNQHPAMQHWQPTFHCMAEPASAYEKPYMSRLLETCLTGYTSTTHVFPIEVKAIVEGKGLVPAERMLFVAFDGRVASAFDHLDLTGPLPAPHDTSILAVSLAIALGCSPIVLLGLDYNWLSHRATNEHFYKDDEVPWPAEDLAKSRYLDLLRMAIPCWEAHEALAAIAARTGQIIVNATEGTFLDAYPAASLDRILSDPDRQPGVHEAE